MRHLLVIIFAFNLAHSALCQEKTSRDAKHLPKHIQTPVTESHARFKGTRVFCVISSEYKYQQHKGYYQKNDHQYIKVLDSELSNFVQARPYFIKERLENVNKMIISHYEDITLNGYDALYTESVNELGLSQIDVYFGDSSFIVTITAVCGKDDTDGKKELQNILQSVHYDKTVKADPLELANISIDMSITGFKHTATTYNVFMYAENGQDDAHNQSSNSLRFTFLREMVEGEIYDYFYWTKKGYEQSLRLKNKDITKTKINDFTAYVLETEIYNGEKFGILYQVVLVNNNDILTVVATAYDNTEDYLVKFKRTVETIKFH
jgi:hypothetical protein